MRRITGLAVGLLFFGTIVGQPASAHAGGHWLGAYTSARYDGVYGGTKVSNPSVPGNSDDVFFSRIWAIKNFSCPAGTRGIGMEVGWVESGRDIVNGYPARRLYVQWGTTCDTFSTQVSTYTLSTGSYVYVHIIKHSSCVIGDTWCYWIAQVLDESTGKWANFGSWRWLPMDRLYAQEADEINNADSGSHWALATSADNGRHQWIGGSLRYSDGTWQTWDTEPTVQMIVPAPPMGYCIEWVNQWWWFESRKC